MDSLSSQAPKWRRSKLARFAMVTVLGAGAMFAFAACSDEDDPDLTPAPTGTNAPASPTTAGNTPPPNNTPVATPTKPANTPTVPAATPITTPKPDGTVARQNPGDTTDKTVKSNPDPITGVATVKHLRLGHHTEEGGWERIVFEMEGPLRPSARIEYIETGVAQCGSGEAVTLPGQAILSITMYDANAHTPEGQPTLDGGKKEVDTPPGGKTILKGVQLCDFEAQVQWAFGLTGKQNYKVTTLENPTRIVIDIKQ